MKLATIFCVLACFSLPLQAQWTKTNGPAGGEVNGILKINNYLVVGAGPGGVYRSDDNGEHWSAANLGLPSYPHCYALASNGTILYASIYASGIFKSTDFGASWSPAGSGLQGKTFYSLLADGMDVYAGESNGGFYYSDNNGDTWTKRGNDIGAVRSFVFTGERLLVAASSFSTGIASVYKSTDKGINLTNLNAPVTSINAMAGSGNSIYVVGGQPMAISRDFGDTWTTNTIGTTGSYLLSGIFAAGDKVIIPGANSTLFVSEDEGIIWSSITNLPYAGSVSATYSENNTIIVGGHEGIYITPNNGASWLEKNDGLTNVVVTQLKATKDVVFTGTAIGIFASLDNGTTWNKSNNGLIDNTGFKFLEGVVIKGIHIINLTDVVVGTSRGIYKSENSGQSWASKITITEINSSLHVLAGDEQKLCAFRSAEQYYSTNGGDTWATKSNSLFNNIGLTNALVKGDTIVVLAHNDIIVSTDFGVSYQSRRMTINYVAPNEAIFFKNKLYAATYQGVFVSPDLGVTWTKLNGLPTDQIMALCFKNNALYVGTNKGVYVSYDQGLEWYPLNNGMSNITSSPLAFNDSYAFVGTYGMSVWRNLQTNLNVRPEIAGLINALEFQENTDITIDLNNLRINDPDSDFPTDFTLTVKAGANYTVAGNIISPAHGYRGELTIPLVVNDGNLDSDEFIVITNVVTGLNEDAAFNSVTLFPNPTHQKINFSINQKIRSCRILDSIGREVARYDDNLGYGQFYSIDVAHLSNGIYLLEFQGNTRSISRFSKF